MKNLRDLIDFPNPERLPARQCQACRKATRHGKEFCSEHVLQQPYARDVQRVWESGVTVLGDIITDLQVNGPRTVERLARNVDRTDEEVLALVRKLRRLGKVRLGQTKRGSVLVKLVA